MVRLNWWVVFDCVVYVYVVRVVVVDNADKYCSLTLGVVSSLLASVLSHSLSVSRSAYCLLPLHHRTL